MIPGAAFKEGSACGKFWTFCLAGSALMQVLPVQVAIATPNAPTLEKTDVAHFTRVLQLRDVSPGDWAYEALQNLTERYGCVNQERGNQTLTRYEFAAELSACLQQLKSRITPETADFATLKRLQKQFVQELAILRGEVDGLQARVTELELTQFSATTKLTGKVFFNLAGAFANGEVTAEVANPILAQQTVRPGETRQVDEANTSFSNLTWLTLNTSFTGRDRLVTQLAVGNGFASAGLFNTLGVPYSDRTAGVSENEVVLRELFYAFPVSDRLQAVIGSRINYYRYFDNNRFTSFITSTSSVNASGSTLLNTLERGAGAILLWEISEQLELRVGYLGENSGFLPSSPFNSASNPTEGLFGGTNTLTSEVIFSPTERVKLRFLYNRSYLQATGRQVDGTLGEPIYGFADDRVGVSLDDATADTFSFNFDWLVSSGLGVFGHYGYGTTHLNPQTPGLSNGEVNAQSLQLGVAFPDLGKEGAQATISYLIPFSVLDGQQFLISGGGDRGGQYEWKLTYYYPLTDNIALTPAFYLIGNPNHFSDNPNVYIGNLRAQFSF